MVALCGLSAHARRWIAVCAAAGLSSALVSCGGSGSSSPSAVGTTISFAGSQITNNTLTLVCDTPETFTVEQSNYTGNFSLVDNYPNLNNGTNSVTLTPVTGQVGTTFTIEFFYGSASTFTIAAVNGSGLTGTLNVKVTC